MENRSFVRKVNVIDYTSVDEAKVDRITMPQGKGGPNKHAGSF